jgi:RNA-directed DNA polymerase
MALTMRWNGKDITRFADDWVVLCKTITEARKVLEDAKVILGSMGLILHPEKTRITHINDGFEFLGYKLKRGKGLKLPRHKIKKGPNKQNFYVIPTEKSVKRFMETIRNRTKRKVPMTLGELVDWINPVIRGWGNYYRKAHVRKLFNKLQRWITRRLWSNRIKRWRNAGWKRYPVKMLYSFYGLVNLTSLIPDLNRNSASIG